MSCLVAGEDESRWVAYGLFDTYFDAVDEAKETVEAYHEDAVKEGGMNADPLAFGVIDAEKTRRTPREHFPSCFRIRIAQVKRERTQVVAKIRQSIRDYEQVVVFSLVLQWRVEQCESKRSCSLRNRHREEVFGNGKRCWYLRCF
jgi:hypothetical protein